jgi:hypothetical protein
MEKMSHFFSTPRGRGVAIGGCVLTLMLVVYSAKSAFGPSEIGQMSRHRTFVCSETGKSFEANVDIGMQVPIHSPYSGKNTGYEAELCYWTADGGTKQKPTAVLLNDWIGKKGPTFCPDCNRLVVGHNPTPEQRQNPPPTEAEYRSKRAR